MKKFLMIASAAAMAVTMPALADPGKKEGKGQRGGDRGAWNMERGGGGEWKRDRGDERRYRGEQRSSERGERSRQRAFERDDDRRSERRGQFAERDNKAREKYFERQAKQREKLVERRAKAERKAFEEQRRWAERSQRARFADRNRDWQGRDRDWDDRDWDDRRERNERRYERSRYAGNWQSFCPPGLAAKNNGCLPPGQARKMNIGQRFRQDWSRNSQLPYDYRNLYAGNDQYYYRPADNGYMYRIDRGGDLIAGLMPLLGGGFQVGQMLPAGYDVYNVPLQYRDTYYDSDDLNYRFGDNAIYQVDPQTRMIETVVALLTGQNFNVGQQMPMGYDMYNLPMQYRDQYYDTPEYNYRYADGNIYQVDPTTQIIQAVIQALV